MHVSKSKEKSDVRPTSAKARASTLPRPLAPPVTSATLPFSSISKPPLV